MMMMMMMMGRARCLVSVIRRGAKQPPPATITRSRILLSSVGDQNWVGRESVRLFSSTLSASRTGVFTLVCTSIYPTVGCVNGPNQFSASWNNAPLSSHNQNRSFSPQTLTQSSSSTHDLVVELISRIEQDEDIVRARVLASEAKPAVQDTQHRALKDIASDFCQSYLSADQLPMVAADDSSHPREDVVLHLVKEYGIDYSSVDHAVGNYHSMCDMSDERQSMSIATRLRQACTPRYIRIFNHILSDAKRDLGLTCLIQMRNDIRGFTRRLKRETSVHKEDAAIVLRLKEMDNDLKTLLATLFLQPILELRRITYEDTPAAIIEKIAMKEAVHPLRSLDDLRTRLGPNRRCFAFFHPSLKDEPLVFVHVALLPLIPETMEDIDEYSSDSPGVATFYSITNTQPGLSGVDLGNFLIKRVVEELQMEFPDIKTFCTLSPIPRLHKWIESKLSQDKKFFDSTLLNDYEMQTLSNVLGCPVESASSALVEFLKDSMWYEQTEKAEAVKPVLMKLAAHYLAKEKHRGRPIDGVAKFHVRNGAEMYRLNYLADKSRKGIHNNAGMMINYRYALDTIEKNSIAYESNGIVPVKEGVSKWIGE